eukprot:CAMPEP_0113678870 /NCGR_PEP_ID=MMETSP0038_2-20120614/10235_1 /TAXON_ID=2898 /ORGANISM="Cryptomonas paramecium" /LENGTH=187 /DNA_ID=CAMNT_0000596651 /DNA_START=202 /DNA_END=761 /DNA_ORIENTATION=- /assembly_acc=CAM_ASM_000170
MSMVHGQMLMPVQSIDSDIEDMYNAKTGKIEHDYTMRQTLGSGFEETAMDKRLSKSLKDSEDRAIQDGDQLPPLDTIGGLGSSQNVHGIGASEPAWYSSWWASGTRAYAYFDPLVHFTSFRGLKDGSDKLVDSGLNVDGWEPGRTREQVKADQRSGQQVPAGFWRADLTQAGAPDSAIHHPCGSALR